MSTNRLGGFRPLVTGSGGRIGGGIYCEIIEGASLFLELMRVIIFQFVNAIVMNLTKQKIDINRESTIPNPKK